MPKLTPAQVPEFDRDDPAHHWALNMLNFAGEEPGAPAAMRQACGNWPVFVRAMLDEPSTRAKYRRPPIDPGELAGWDGRDPDHHMAMWMLGDVLPTMSEASIDQMRARWREAVPVLLEVLAMGVASVRPSPFAPAAAPPAPAPNRAARRRDRGRPGWWPF